MKWMMVVLFIGVGFAGVNTAVAACGPPKCPVPEQPQDPLRPVPTPGSPREVTAIGYFEVASPECTEEAYNTAILGAEQKAVQDARRLMGVRDVILLKPFRYSAKCEQSIYAGSFRGNSWIVQAFGKFGRQ